jgi:hypothetical protein
VRIKCRVLVALTMPVCFEGCSSSSLAGQSPDNAGAFYCCIFGCSADMHTTAAQTKLVLALREYRLLHASASRGTTLPHNKLIFPPSLRYLPVWILGPFFPFRTFPAWARCVSLCVSNLLSLCFPQESACDMPFSAWGTPCQFLCWGPALLGGPCMKMPLWKCFLGLARGSQSEALLDAVWTQQSCIVCQACYCHLLVCWSQLHGDTISFWILPEYTMTLTTAYSEVELVTYAPETTTSR